MCERQGDCSSGSILERLGPPRVSLTLEEATITMDNHRPSRGEGCFQKEKRSSLNIVESFNIVLVLACIAGVYAATDDVGAFANPCGRPLSLDRWHHCKTRIRDQDRGATYKRWENEMWKRDDVGKGKNCFYMPPGTLQANASAIPYSITP